MGISFEFEYQLQQFQLLLFLPLLLACPNLLLVLMIESQARRAALYSIKKGNQSKGLTLNPQTKWE